MKKAKTKNIFLDTNILLMYLSGDKKAERIFEAYATNNISFYISSIVKQEIYLALNYTKIKRTNSLIKLEKIFSFVNVIETEDIVKESKLYSKVLTKIATNLSSPLLHGTKIPHSNDVLNIFTALNGCEYFLTNDKIILALIKIEHLKFISLDEYLESKGKL